MPDSPNSSHLKVGSLAAAAGVGLGTIRYYQKLGLLKKPQKLKHGGVRKYSQGDVDLLVMIKNTQAMGFSLEEIGLILVHRDQNECNSVKALITERNKVINSQILAQKSNLKTLTKLLSCCDGNCSDGTCKLFLNLAKLNRPATI